MTLRISTGLATLLAGTTGFSGAMANGVIDIYSGTQPATADSAATGTLLGTVTLNAGAFTPGSTTNGLTFSAASAGVVSKSGVWSFVGIAAGTAGWFRFRGNAVDSGGISTALPRLDGSVATSGANLNLSNISIAVGAPTTVDTFTWTQPLQ